MLTRSTLRAAFFLTATASLLGTAACAGDSAETQEENISQRTNVKAKAGDLTLYLRQRANWTYRDGKNVLVIRGSANRNVKSIRSWVPDDSFGQVNMLTDRTFEIVLGDGSEANTILSGAPLFLDIETHTGNPKFYHARFELDLEFYAFRGSRDIWLGNRIDPVYVRDSENALRYQGKLYLDRDATDAYGYTDDDSDPVMTRLDPRTYTFDWSYGNLVLASDFPTDPVYFHADFTDGSDADKSAGILTLVDDLSLTMSDPYTAWPEPGCKDSVKTCIELNPNATDLGFCGSYREVDRCMDEVDPCPGATFELTAFDASDELDGPLEVYNDGCSFGGQWCSMSSAETYTIPACFSETTTLADVVTWFEGMQSWQGWGQELSRAQLENIPAFGTTYSSGGPGLLLAADIVAGGGEVSGYYSSLEVPCHNCTDFSDQVVLFYPQTGTVVFFVGGHGYDS